MALAAATFGTISPSAAVPPEIAEPGAYGFFAGVSLFNGPTMNVGPEPAVVLPAAGSPTPITATQPTGRAQFGPAVLIDSGPQTVSTEGTPGNVTSSAEIVGIGDAGVGPILYQGIKSTCTGATGSSTFTGTQVQTKTDPVSQEPTETVDVPTNPPPNYEISGTIDHVGDRFRIVFNEQVTTGGAMTVNAVHMYLLGDVARGDLIIGQVRCGAGGGTVTTTTAPPSVTTTTPTGGTGTGTGTGGSGTGSTTGSGTGSMATTGTDTWPLTFLALELVLAGGLAIRWAARRRAWPR